MPRNLPSLLAAAVCLLALTCAAPALAADTAPAVPQKDELLFSQASPRATLSPTKCRCDGRYVLTLRGVDKHTVWFSDRPNRHAGHMATRNFARTWSSYGFSADPPDAALSALDSAGRRRSDVVELTHPRYDAKHQTMRYRARTVPYSTGPLKKAKRSTGVVAGRLHDVSLFIDDATARVVDGCLLARHTDCRGMDLRGANLSGVDLTGAHLNRANLQGATLQGADLSDANLRDADLSAANLSGTSLFHTDLSFANLSNSYRADLWSAILCGTKMGSATFINTGC